MGKGLFVTGTGTDVGKTFVTALMVKKLREHGYDGSYYKAALSGAETGKDGGLIPGDAQFVKMAAGLSEARDTLEDVVEPYLIQTGLVARTARGRVLNGPAWAHLGLRPPTAQPVLPLDDE